MSFEQSKKRKTNFLFDRPKLNERMRMNEMNEWMQKRQSGNKNAEKKCQSIFFNKRWSSIFGGCLSSSPIGMGKYFHCIFNLFCFLALFEMFIVRCISNSFHLLLFSVNLLEDVGFICALRTGNWCRRCKNNKKEETKLTHFIWMNVESLASVPYWIMVSFVALVYLSMNWIRFAPKMIRMA